MGVELVDYQYIKRKLDVIQAEIAELLREQRSSFDREKLILLRGMQAELIIEASRLMAEGGEKEIR